MSRPLNEKPMVVLILEHLQSGQSISNMIAAAKWRCRALPKRISELRSQGHTIRREWRKDATGQRYVQYTLTEQGDKDA